MAKKLSIKLYWMANYYGHATVGITSKQNGSSNHVLLYMVIQVYHLKIPSSVQKLWKQLI